MDSFHLIYSLLSHFPPREHSFAFLFFGSFSWLYLPHEWKYIEFVFLWQTYAHHDISYVHTTCKCQDFIFFQIWIAFPWISSPWLLHVISLWTLRLFLSLSFFFCLFCFCFLSEVISGFALKKLYYGGGTKKLYHLLVLLVTQHSIECTPYSEIWPNMRAWRLWRLWSHAWTYLCHFEYNVAAFPSRDCWINSHSLLRRRGRDWGSWLRL